MSLKPTAWLAFRTRAALAFFPALLLAASSPPRALARPVSFLGGYTLMSENRFDQNELMAAYSFHPRLSAGLHYNLLRLGDPPAPEEHHAVAMLNARVFRLNTDFWQCNLYLSVGGGVRSRAGQGTDPRAAAAIEADAETRRFYSSLKAEGWGYLGDQARHYLRGRAGFAPYLAEMNGLHAWVVAQAEYNTWRESTEVTPLLRFFYQNFIFELGSSLTGRAQVNFAAEL